MNNTDTIDLKVNKIMKKLSNNWHKKEKYNYADVLQREAYQMYMKYYTGQNPYNILDKKYKNRIYDLGL